MKTFKQIWARGKAQLQKQQARLVIGVVGGFLIGVGADNMGLGIALAVALGVSGYLSGKKNERDVGVDVNQNK